MTKTLASSDQAFTTGKNLAVGEVGTYTVTWSFPEGTTPRPDWSTPSPPAWCWSGWISITASGNLSASAGTFTSILNAATILEREFVHADLGDVLNPDETPGRPTRGGRPVPRGGHEPGREHAGQAAQEHGDELPPGARTTAVRR
ncbi:MAG: hypothetical protein U0835_20700 [Isosphaeraceae bacterium]